MAVIALSGWTQTSCETDSGSRSVSPSRSGLSLQQRCEYPVRGCQRRNHSFVLRATRHGLIAPACPPLAIAAADRGVEGGCPTSSIRCCQGRSKIRPRWRRKTRPPGRWAECLSAVVRTGWSGVWDRPWGGLRRSGNPCAQPAPSWGGGVRAPGRPRGGGPSCCVRGGSCRR